MLSLTNNEIKILKYLSNTHINNLIDSITIKEKTFEIIKQYLLYYISYHIINIKNMKSTKFIE